MTLTAPITALAFAMALSIGAALPALAQQVSDADFDPSVAAPAFAAGRGPVVLIDEAHQNFHTADGRYAPFAALLRKDGYRVEASSAPVSAEMLARADLFVIANAVADTNVGNWTLPTPSAFAQEEIDALDAWVRRGGSLLLIADHMPFPGAVAGLAERFGILMGNGFAFAADGRGILRFGTDDGTLASHPIVRGRTAEEAVTFVTSFTGQAFRVAPDVPFEPLMVLGDGTYLILPSEAWQFSDTTPRIAAAGLLQGAVLRPGLGRLAVFGEAAMFSAQLAGPNRIPVGMNHPEAPQNAQFLLNVMHWLSDPRHGE